MIGDRNVLDAQLQEAIRQIDRTPGVVAHIAGLSGAKSQELARVSQYKSQFLTNMSHEIRTPLNAILGMTTLAQKQNPSLKISEYLGKIGSSARLLTELIEDILDLSRIETGRIEIARIDFDLDERSLESCPFEQVGGVGEVVGAEHDVDMRRTLAHSEFFVPPSRRVGAVTHDVHRARVERTAAELPHPSAA